MSGDLSAEMKIGEVLKQARARAGLDIRTVEERTKIRVKYLRALEDEEWEALPSPAYAKGFLRTYAQVLGLDGEALADAYRRQVERGGRADPGYPLGEQQVLERRRRLADETERPGWVVALLAVGGVVAGVLLAIGLLGGDDENGGEHQRKATGKHERKHEGGGGGAPEDATVTLGLSIREPVQVCLVGGGGQALIDGQVLNPGDEESYERKRFELRFPSGFDPDQFTLEVNGKPRLLPKASGPAAYGVIAPQRVVPIDPPGKSCP